MIPALAVMIGFYLIVQYSRTLRDELARQSSGTPTLPGFLSVIGIIITLVALVYILWSAHEVGQSISEIQRAAEGFGGVLR